MGKKSKLKVKTQKVGTFRIPRCRKSDQKKAWISHFQIWFEQRFILILMHNRLPAVEQPASKKRWNPAHWGVVCIQRQGSSGSASRTWPATAKWPREWWKSTRKPLAWNCTKTQNSSPTGKRSEIMPQLNYSQHDALPILIPVFKKSSKKMYKSLFSIFSVQRQQSGCK